MKKSEKGGLNGVTVPKVKVLMDLCFQIYRKRKEPNHYDS